METAGSDDFRIMLERLQHARSQLSEILEALRGGETDRDHEEVDRSVAGDAIALLYEAGQITFNESRSMTARMVDRPGPVSEDDVASLLSLMDNAISRYQAAADDQAVIPGGK